MRSSLFACVLLVLACDRTGPAEVSPPAASEPAVTVAPEAEAPGPTTTQLRPIALRDGPLALFVSEGRAFVSMDGEPVALHPGEALQRRPELGRGLPPRESYFGFPTFEIVDFAGDPERPGSAHLVLAEHFDRAGSSYATFRLEAEGWERVVTKHEMLTEHYPELVSLPGGVVIGLRSHNLDSNDIDGDLAYDDEGSPETEAFWDEVNAALKSAPKGLVILAGGDANTPTPELPAGWEATSLAADRSGDLFALASQSRDDDDDEDGSRNPSLLRWAPGETKATILALPEPGAPSATLYDLRLWNTGDHVFVSGFESIDDGEDRPRLYLATNTPDGWARIPVELAGLEDEWAMQIRSVAQTDTGELWLTTGHPMNLFERDQPRLWRQRDGSWEPVTLDPVASPLDATTRWVRDPLEHRWVELEPTESEPELAAAMTVAWAEGTLWVLADLGRAFAVSGGEMVVEERRVGLYASRPAPATELPSYDRVHRERANQDARDRKLEVGDRACGRFSLVLLDDPNAHPKQRDALIAGFETLAEDLDVDDAYVDSLLVGRLDDASPEQLVIEASAYEPKAGKKLQAEVDRLLGIRTRGDCLVRGLVDMSVNGS